MSSQQPASQSFSMSHDEIDYVKINERVASLNYQYLQVHRPDEGNILQYMDESPRKQLSEFEVELARNPSRRKKPSVADLGSPKSFSPEEHIFVNDSPLKLPVESSVLLRQDGPPLEIGKPDNRSMASGERKRTNVSSPRRKMRKTSKLKLLYGRMELVKKFINIIKSLNPIKKQPNTKQAYIIADSASEVAGHTMHADEMSSSIKHRFTKQVLKGKHDIKRSKTIIAKKRSLIQWVEVIQGLGTKTINPETSFVFFWQQIKLILIYFILFHVSVCISFGQPINAILFLSTDSEGSRTIFGVLATCFMLDMLLSLKTGFYRAGEPILDQPSIAKHYMHTIFLVDFVTLVPLLLDFIYAGSFEETFALRVVNCVLFLKIQAIRTIFANIQFKFQSNAYFQTAYQFISVIKLILFYAHIVGCLWYIVGTGTTYQRTWLNSVDIDFDHWSVNYVYSIYWAVTTMSTIGYGDITPKNPIEVLFAIFTMLISSIMFAYSLNTIGNTINAMTLTSRRIQTNMAIINSYMRRKNLDQPLQFRVRQYLQNLWFEDSKYRFEDETRILNSLSMGLQEEIQISLYGKFIFSIPVLYRYFSQQFLLTLTKNIREQKIPPKANIIEMGSYEEQGLYYLIEGEADIVLDLASKKQIIGKFKKGDIFGQAAFFYNQPHAYTVKTREACTYAYVQYADFVQLLRTFPKDYQTYRMLIDRIDLRRQVDHIDMGMVCFGCGSRTHDIDLCPNLHLIVDQLTLLRKYIYSRDQERKKQPRNGRRSTNARFGQKLFEDAASFFQENNLSIMSDSNGSVIREGRNPEGTQRSLKSKNSSTHRSQKERKRSRSLNSIVIRDESKSSYLQQPSHNSYNSQQELQPSQNMESLSAIIAPQQNPQSLLSQSSFNLFGKERKISRQQDSDRISNTSNTMNQINIMIHKSSSQSKSHRENSHSSGSNQLGMQPQVVPVAVPAATPDEVSFQKQDYEDSVLVTQKRKKKSQIGRNDSPPRMKKVQTIAPKLYPIPSVSEMDQSRIAEGESSRQPSIGGSVKQFYKTYSQQSEQDSQMRQISQKYQELRKSGKKLSGKQSFQSRHSVIYEEEEIEQVRLQQASNNHRGSSRFTGETFKQFLSNPPELPIYDFYDSFESPQNMQSYFPSQNIEVVLSNYIRYQQDREKKN